MLRILFVFLTLSILVIACSDNEQSPNPMVTPQPSSTPTDTYTEAQNQKIENIEHTVDGLMQEWQQIKADLDAGIMPDLDSLKTSVDTLLGDLGTIQQELEKLTTLINAKSTPSTPDATLPPETIGDLHQPLPAGGEIVFYRQSEGHDIWIMAGDGNNQRRLTTHPATDNFPAWSHDGQQLAFLSHRQGAQLKHGPNIWMMDADGSNLQLVVQTEGGDYMGPPRWMAFGGIAYKRHGNVVTGNKHILFNNDPFEVVWSHQGHVALVEYTSGGGQEDIYIEPLFDRRIRLTYNPANDDQPAWNPAGDRIAYRSHTSDASYEIFIVNIDGTGHRNLTNYPGDDGWPTWSPDGNHIAFQSNRDNRFDWDIYVIDATGANLQNLTNNIQHNEIQPAWRPR